MPIDIADIRAQIEQELTWRWAEMVLLKNQLGTMRTENERKNYRKALVVMLYAHYEGFCKAALIIYVGSLNSADLRCAEVKDCIAAATLSNVFKEYDNPTKKSSLFKSKLPDDSKLHRFARQADFIGEMREVWNLKVNIPENIVDTESNLKPIVLSKILYRLGFSQDAFHAFDAEINQLLQRRNDIAHGSGREGLEEIDYAKIESATLKVANALVRLIYDSIRAGSHLKIV